MLQRHAVGYVLRDERSAQSLTLREVSAKSAVALGYLSEVERGQKEVSSELLEMVAGSLRISVSTILRRAADLMDMETALSAPSVDTLARM
jgi:transcriptional regulator with XRE-family HTH domain